MTRFSALLLSCSSIVFALAGCHTPENKAFDAGSLQSNLSPERNSAAANLLTQYVSLKNALVEGSSEQAAHAAHNMQTSLQQLGNYGDSVAVIGKSTTDSLQQSLSCILATSDKSCERQRICFKPLSDALYSLLQQVQAKGLVLYHQFCPMAMNEHGAYWLSPSPEIENPYFGAKMLTCGEVVDTLK